MIIGSNEQCVKTVKRSPAIAALTVLVLSMMLVLFACSTPTAQEEESSNAAQSSEQDQSTQNQVPQDQSEVGIAVDVKIVNGAENNTLMAEAYLEVPEGSTVYDALVLVTSNAEVSLNASASEYGMYVMSIGGLATGDYGETSGWMYSVNGKDAEIACDSYVLEDGDSLEWKYVTEW